MAWLRIDDTVPTHRKHLKAGPAACWLWVCGIAYCQRHLTDGVIPVEALPLLGVTKDAQKLADKLVEAGLFDRVDGGYEVHDYLALNAKKEDAVAKRERQHTTKQAAGRAGAAARWQKDSSVPSTLDSTPMAGAHSSAMAPSHPLPSHLSTATLSPEVRAHGDPLTKLPPNGRTHGVLTGALPRDHMSHAECSPNMAWCVPTSVHGKFRTALLARHGGDPDAAASELRAWYAEIWATLPDDTVIGDAFRFWQPRFDAKFVQAATTSAPVLDPAAIAAEVARLTAEVGR